MKNITLAFVLALGLGACGGDAADEINKLAKDACACKDKACGDAVNKKLDKALEKLSSEEELKKVATALGEAGMCLGKLGVGAE